MTGSPEPSAPVRGPAPQRREAVIFDMDGVIVDSEPTHEAAFLDVMEDLGYAGRHGIRFADYVGRTDRDLWVDFLRLHSPAQSMEELLQLKQRKVVERIRRDQPLFPGLLDLVAALAPHYHLGLASGSDRPVVDEVLNLGGLRAFFPVNVSGSEIERGKPAPDVFLRTAELMRVEPRDCWVIEDSIPGVMAALAAGMRVIAITNTYPAASLKNATHVVGSYLEIAQLLLPR